MPRQPPQTRAPGSTAWSTCHHSTLKKLIKTIIISTKYLERIEEQEENQPFVNGVGVFCWDAGLPPDEEDDVVGGWSLVVGPDGEVDDDPPEPGLLGSSIVGVGVVLSSVVGFVVGSLVGDFGSVVVGTVVFGVVVGGVVVGLVATGLHRLNHALRISATVPCVPVVHLGNGAILIRLVLI